MDYASEYKKFVNSYNFTYALRATVALSLPALVLGYFGMLPHGLAASVGAMCVSNADVPGAPRRRFNGMLATLVLCGAIAVIIGLSLPYPVLLGIIITLLSFLLTFIGIYGSRVNTVGFAGLFVMVLCMDAARTTAQVWQNSIWITAGGALYMLLSMLLFRVRPYRIIQQALGDYIFSTGDYLKTRASFYDEELDYDKVYRELMHQQQAIHEKQELLREIIFKSRTITRQSTITSRTLLIIFIEAIDLFEKATGTIYNYKSMHRRFDGKNILPHFQKMILEMADALHQIGLSVQGGKPSPPGGTLTTGLKKLQQDYNAFVALNRSPDNVAPMVTMRKVMDSITEMAGRIDTLQQYTRYDKAQVKDYKLQDNYESFVAPTSLNRRLLLENLTFSSNTFRHAIRVSGAVLTGFIASHLLQIGHSYWVLLTILVILKPSYSLTKQRNYQRLTGTLCGAVVGAALVYFVPNAKVLLAAMFTLMLTSFSFIRTKYFIGVLFMTAYLLIFFFILDAAHFTELLKLRIIDTLIGSAIAFTATYILVPSWEKRQLRSYMSEELEEITLFYQLVAYAFIHGSMDEVAYRHARKNAFISLANLSGGFTRMLNEPKSKQDKASKAHEFVVLITTLNSHIIALADFAQKLSQKYKSEDYRAITMDTLDILMAAKKAVDDTGNITRARDDAPAQLLQDDVGELLTQRKRELKQGLIDTETKNVLLEYKPIVDQFLFINKLVEDILKAVNAMAPATPPNEKRHAGLP